MSIKEKFIAAIEETDDPLAGIKLQNAFAATTAIGQMMARIADLNETENYTEKLLKAFPSDMDSVAADPSFICALSALLSNAIIQYGRNL